MQAANLVHQTSTSTGTGNLTLATVNGKQSFDTAFSHGTTEDVFVYFISNHAAAEWERGTGHMSDATTLVRDTVIESSNSDAAVDFSAGTKDVTNAIPADNLVSTDATQTLTNKTLTSPKITGVTLYGKSTDGEASTYPSQFQQDFTITAANVGSAGAVVHDIVVDDESTGKDNGAFRSIMRQVDSGNSKIRAGEFHTVRAVGDGTKHTWALELGVHSSVAPSDEKEGAGVYLYNNHTGWLSSGTRAGSALRIEGEDGWTNFLEFRDTDNTTVLFKVDQNGAISGSKIRETLTAARTYYVRSDGSNSNTGLANTSGGALLTIQAALNKIAKLDFNGKVVTVQVSSGTFTNTFTIPATVGQANIADLVIVGDTTTPSNCVLNVSGFVVTCPAGARAKIRGFKLQGGAASQPLMFATGSGAYLQYDLCEFGTATAEHVAAYSGGVVERVGNVTISGGATSHVRAYVGGNNLCQSGVGTLTGTPAFSTAFARATENGTNRTTAASWSGSATGTRFISDTGGGNQTFGGSASLPGDAAGTTTSPGWTA